MGQDNGGERCARVSIKVQSYVWDNSKCKGSALLLLLAIADHAHDDGTGAYPSVETLAAKCRQTVRNTQTLLRELEKNGEIVTDAQAGPHGCNVYTIPMGGEKIAPVKSSARGVKSSAPPVKTSVEEVRQISPEPSLTINEPSEEPSIISASKNDAPKRKPKSENNLFPIAQEIATVCGMDLSANRGIIFRQAKTLATSAIAPTPDIIRAQYGAGGWWYRADWRGQKGQRPAPTDICKTWGMWQNEKIIPFKQQTKGKAEQIRDAFRRFEEMSNGEQGNYQEGFGGVVDSIPADERDERGYTDAHYRRVA